MLPHQSRSNSNKVHGIPSQSSHLNSKDSNHSVVVSPPIIYPAFDSLNNVDHLFLEEESRTSEMTNYSIVSESGERLFYARVTYCFIKFLGGRSTRHEKLISGIEILNATGNIVANTSTIAEEKYATCGSETPECYLNDFTIDIYGQPWAELNLADKTPCGCPNKFHLSTINGPLCCKFISERGSCLCCCACCPKPFRIYDETNNDLIGRMHRNWENHPGVFGLSFPESMRNKLKALLLVCGIYLNAQYFEKQSCYWGHAGVLGTICYGRWFMWIFMVICVCTLVPLWWFLKNKKAS